MAKKRVGIIKGGPSHEHKHSLKTGENVLKNLPKHYEAYDIFVDLNGNWYLNNKFTHPEKVARVVDVVFNATHGHYGEDGKVQQLLESFAIPHTGSDVFSSALGMNKMLAKKSFKDAGLSVPLAIVVDADSSLELAAVEATRRVGANLFVKPVDSGSGTGLAMADSLPGLIEAIKHVGQFSQNVLVEEFIKGQEASVGVIENFRNQKLYSLPVVEIRDGMHVVPAKFSMELKKKLEEAAIKAHKAIGARHYSETDFIITPKGRIYVLEINTQPKLAEGETFTKALESVGVKYSDFLDHLITLALKK
jgi:D-alanine-D-alanine ligase